MIGWLRLVLALLILVFSLYRLFRICFEKSREKKKLDLKVAKTLNYIADENDFLLLHDVKASLLSDTYPTSFGHILFVD